MTETKELKPPEAKTLFDNARRNRVLATEIYELLGIHLPDKGEEKAVEANNLRALQGVMEDTKELLQEISTTVSILGGK